MSVKKNQIFKKRIDSFLKLNKKFGKPKIAIGLLAPDKEILKGLKKGKEYAEIILVGPDAIKNIVGFEKIITFNSETELVSMLVENEAQGIIRGTIDDFKTYEVYQKLTGNKDDINPAVMEDPFGRQFLLSSISNPGGWAKEERLGIVRGLAEFLNGWGVKPKIAVFSAVRHETYQSRKNAKDDVQSYLNKTYEDAVWLSEQLTKYGYEAKNLVIELNAAVEGGYNIIVPVNGMVGNQIFRAVMFCGGKVVAAPRLGLDHCYEDNSRTEKDFLPHVKWLVAWINSKKL